MTNYEKVQAINSRLEIVICGCKITVHFIPTKRLRFKLLKRWVLGR